MNSRREFLKLLAGTAMVNPLDLLLKDCPTIEGVPATASAYKSAVLSDGEVWGEWTEAQYRGSDFGVVFNLPPVATLGAGEVHIDYIPCELLKGQQNPV